MTSSNLVRLHDRQVLRLSALEYAPRIEANLTVGIGQAGAVAHQSAGIGKIIATRVATIATIIFFIEAPRYWKLD
jgi:hypothetical protein